MPSKQDPGTSTILGAIAEDWRDVRTYVERHETRAIVEEVATAFTRNNVLTSASAVAFQTLFAIIPMLLAAVAVMSFLDVEQVWTEWIAPELRGRVSPAAFELVQSAVDAVFGTQRTFWLTFGLGLALWELSGAIRALMRALNDIYGGDEQRPLLQRYALSLALAAVLGLVLGLALAALQLAPRTAEALDLGALAPVVIAAAWVLAFALIVLAVGLLMRFGANVPQPARWLGFGTLLVVVGWTLASVGFATYATELARYGTIYSSLGVVILLLTYLYLSAIVFLGAAQLDALVRSYAHRR